MVAGFVLAQVMRHLLLWKRFAWPTRIVSILAVVLLVLTGATSDARPGGLFERSLAFVAAAAVASPTVGTARIPSRPRAAKSD